MCIRDRPKTKWDEEFETEKSRCFIRFNNPASLTSDGSPEYSIEITSDNRLSLRDLRIRIAETLALAFDAFIMRKSGSFGQELRDLDQPLNELGIFNSCNVYIEFGRPSLPGDYKLHFHIATILTNLDSIESVSYTHLTLPTIYSV
eukprot:TRINITY_DN10114_c0_g1_i1.p1 TRINITY_DN10114_c0_g1~~TRINITY_DN10114_c0_g1_i1.p1  ORF type:complete len:161 (+),score=35.03 TRINITY_DN10114_c0_g1_i1:48-485(+)